MGEVGRRGMPGRYIYVHGYKGGPSGMQVGDVGRRDERKRRGEEEEEESSKGCGRWVNGGTMNPALGLG